MSTIQKEGKILRSPSPDIFLLLLLLSFISSLQNCNRKLFLSSWMCAMNISSPKANEDRYQGDSLQHRQNTLTHTCFLSNSLISCYDQQQLNECITSSDSVLISELRISSKWKRIIDYCNLGTVSDFTFHILINLYLTVTAVTAHVQRWYVNVFHNLNPKALDKPWARDQQTLQLFHALCEFTQQQCVRLVLEGLLIVTANLSVKLCLQRERSVNIAAA